QRCRQCLRYAPCPPTPRVRHKTPSNRSGELVEHSLARPPEAGAKGPIYVRAPRQLLDTALSDRISRSTALNCSVTHCGSSRDGSSCPRSMPSTTTNKHSGL